MQSVNLDYCEGSPNG